MHVTQIMTPNVVTVAPETPISEVARLMATEGISGVPVVDGASGELVGIITEMEMIERQATFDAPVYGRLLDATLVIEEDETEQQLRRILATRADELMERTVYSIREDATVEEVASLMFERKVNPVPVISFDDVLIGVVSRSDVIRLMARDFTEPGGEEPVSVDEEIPGAGEGYAAQGPVVTGPAETAPIESVSQGGGERLVVSSDDFADAERRRGGA